MESALSQNAKNFAKSMTGKGLKNGVHIPIPAAFLYTYITQNENPQIIAIWNDFINPNGLILPESKQINNLIRTKKLNNLGAMGRQTTFARICAVLNKTYTGKGGSQPSGKEKQILKDARTLFTSYLS